jgi:5-bromo-4-chloroindolyl phosphate hydrolysis protein
MNPFFSFLIRSFVAVPITVLTWLVTYFPLYQSFWPSTGIAISAGILTHFILAIVMNTRFLNKHQISRKEYRYIRKNLNEARQKINRLNKNLFSIRDISSVKQRIDLLRITKKIHKMTTKEPKRFYQAEQFYFSHLDSIVELTEKYSFLSSQSVPSSSWVGWLAVLGVTGNSGILSCWSLQLNLLAEHQML